MATTQNPSVAVVEEEKIQGWASNPGRQQTPHQLLLPLGVSASSTVDRVGWIGEDHLDEQGNSWKQPDRCLFGCSGGASSRFRGPLFQSNTKRHSSLPPVGPSPSAPQLPDL